MRKLLLLGYVGLVCMMIPMLIRHRSNDEGK